MADISKIKVGSTTYNIKDAQAREDITDQSSQIDALETAEGQTRDMISDAWTQRTWTAGEYCIDNNILWKCKVDNSQRPSEGANWTAVSISTLISELTVANTYSNDEVLVGKWIDGSNLYRKTINTYSPALADTYTTVIDLSSYNINKIVNFFGDITGVPCNSNRPNTNYRAWTLVNKNEVDMVVGSSLAGGKTTTITIEYTKNN